LNWRITGDERRICPPEYQRRIEQIGGLNRFGTANFDIVWSQTATIIKDGKPTLQADGDPCWVLRQWKAPETYGTPEIYYSQNYDETTGTQILGDYPWRGRYEIVQPFRHRAFVNGKLVKEFLPLNSMVIDMVIPIILQCADASYYQRRVALKEIHDREENAKTLRIADRLEDATPAFKGPVSFQRQGCRTSIIEKKIQQIEKNWAWAMKFASMVPKGPSIHKLN
jgi:hypothetical protein